MGLGCVNDLFCFLYYYSCFKSEQKYIRCTVWTSTWYSTQIRIFLLEVIFLEDISFYIEYLI